MDSNKIIYVWGKAQLNLSTEEDKHKFSPTTIDDFRGDKKAKRFAVGHGNSIVLSTYGEVFGFGDNSFFKAGGDDKFVFKNPRLIHFDQNTGENISIVNIFAGYDHLFAISSFGEIYAWGNPRLFRLTKNFGDKIAKIPKIISIDWLHKGSNEAVEQLDDSDTEDTFLDERQIRTVLNKTMKITTFKSIFNFIQRMGNKYNENEIISKDISIIEELIKILNRFSNEFTSYIKNVQNLFLDIDQLTITRIKDIKRTNEKFNSPKIEKNEIFNLIVNQSEEIEKIFTLFFIHPCIMKNILEQLKPEEYQTFMNGIKPLYKNIDKKEKHSENFLAISFISFFRICVNIDYFSRRNDIDELFNHNDITLLEFFLEIFLLDSYNKNILIDILQSSIMHLCNYSQSSRETNNLDSIKELSKIIHDSYNENDYILINLNMLNELIDIFRIFSDDIENNLDKISEHFLYCFVYLRKHIQKDQISSYKDKKNVKRKLINCLVRLFYAKTVGKLFKGLFKDETNCFFICQKIRTDSKSTSRKLFESYFKMIGELFQRIACKQLYVYREPKKKDKEEDEYEDEEEKKESNIKEAIDVINSSIEELNAKIFLRFMEKFPKIKFNLKKHLISSLIYSQLNFNPMKISLELETLIPFLKLLSDKRTKFEGDMHFNILDQISNIKTDSKSTFLKKQIKLCLDTKYLIKPIEFSKRFEKELKITIKLSITPENILRKCKNCHIILPEFFFKDDQGNAFFLKPFIQKIKKEEFLYFSKIFTNKNFNSKGINNLVDLFKNIKKFQKHLEETNNTDIKEYKYLNHLSNLVDDINNDTHRKEDEKMEYFILQIHNYLRKKIRHVNKMTEDGKIVHDLNDACNLFKEYLVNMNNSLSDCKVNLKIFANSLEFKGNTDKSENMLTHRTLKLRTYTNDNAFKYKNVILFLILVGNSFNLSQTKKYHHF